MLLADSYLYVAKSRGYYIMLQYFQTTGSWGLLDGRHNKSVNSLFIDGHVEGVPTKLTLSNESYLATFNPYMVKPFANYADTNNHYWNPY